MTERKSPSHIPIKPAYRREDTQGLPHLEGDPGQYPFTRGIYSDMYLGRPWTMRQYAGYGTAEQSNERYRFLLSQGQTGLSVAFDLPTQIGYDSDHLMAAGEVGKTGVAIDTLADMEILFRDIPLDKVSTSMTINATAFILLALYIAVAKKQDVPARETSRHDPERYPQGIYRAGHIYLPAETIAELDHRYLHLLQG